MIILKQFYFRFYSESLDKFCRIHFMQMKISNFQLVIFLSFLLSFELWFEYFYLSVFYFANHQRLVLIFLYNLRSSRSQWLKRDELKKFFFKYHKIRKVSLIYGNSYVYEFWRANSLINCNLTHLNCNIFISYLKRTKNKRKNVKVKCCALKRKNIYKKGIE